VFLGLGYSRLKTLREEIPFGRILFGGHFFCMAVVFSMTIAAQKGLGWRFLDPFGYTKSAVYLLATVLLALAYIPPRSWMVALRATGLLWLYALLAGVTGWFLGTTVKSLWYSTSTIDSGMMQRATLHEVQAVLGIFRQDVVVDPTTFTIGTQNNTIMISGGCSGIEGLGLVLAFTSIWLWHFRKEIRFPQALLLVPCALGCSWILNIVRLSALILIMNVSGFEDAWAGFHIAAGWISFTAVALAFSTATEKLSWVRRIPPPDLNSAGAPQPWSEPQGESPAIRAYLLPFLAILAAALVSKAASANYEWLYSLRFFAAATALIYFWPELKKLNWRIGWLGPVVGVAVFLMWIAPAGIARILGHPPAVNSLGTALAALSPTARWSWIILRVATAVVTVPIAEELAFRGYLARRFVSREFDRVSFTSLTVLAICLSSIVFGVEHMKDLMDWQHLLLGTVAGIAFAVALRRRGRIGDAVAAHAVCNLLLAAWVLGLGDWAQW